MTILINADGCPGVSDVMKNKTSCRTLPLIRLNLRLWRRWWAFEPTFQNAENLPFGENRERFYALWRERAREIPGARIHPYNMLLLTLTKSKQQRMDEHENSVIKRCENADYEIFHFYIQDFKYFFFRS